MVTKRKNMCLQLCLDFISAFLCFVVLEGYDPKQLGELEGFQNSTREKIL